MNIGIPWKTSENYTITVIDKALEDAEEDIETYENYYTKSIDEIKEEGYIGVCKYLSSIVLQDNRDELLDNFRANTTKDERAGWLWSMRDHWKHGGHSGEQKEYLEVGIRILSNMVSLDNATITDEEFYESIEETSNTAETYYYEAIETKGTIVGSRIPNRNNFEDVLHNIGFYKPGALDDYTSNKVEGIISKILTAITNVGIVAAILILAILGIKYMLGSVEEKAEYKKDLVPYIIGAALLFGILTFVKIFMQWGETISNL